MPSSVQTTAPMNLSTFFMKDFTSQTYEVTDITGDSHIITPTL